MGFVTSAHGTSKQSIVPRTSKAFKFSCIIAIVCCTSKNSDEVLEGAIGISISVCEETDVFLLSDDEVVDEAKEGAEESKVGGSPDCISVFVYDLR